MDFLTQNILTVLIFLPLVAVAVVASLPRENAELTRRVALFFSLVEFGASLFLWTGFDIALDHVGKFQFERKVLWIPLSVDGATGINYHVGMDGISLLLVLLTTLLTPICLLSAWTAVEKRIKEFVSTLLLLEMAMIGVFVALDLILFYVFWEVMLVPMAILIGVWGGRERIYAAIKFVIFTMIGSVLMLIAIISLYFLSGQNSFDYTDISLASFPERTQMLLFAAFGLAFAIKVPMFPLHTWLPWAHVEAPTAGSVILAGVLLKMGTYGFLRFCLPLFPAASHRFLPLIAVLSLIGVIYGALVAMSQYDVKKLVAYSSVSHLGIVMLGIFAFNLVGLMGGALQMLNHGVSTGALFLLVGMIYERRHTRQISDFGGIAIRMPIYAALFTIVTMSSIGLPFLNGFVGEVLVLVGTATSRFMHPITAVFAATGMILGAVYMLRMVRSVFYGPLELEANEKLHDLNRRELALLAPLILLIFWFGVYPKPFKDRMQGSLQRIENLLKQPRKQEFVHRPGKADLR